MTTFAVMRTSWNELKAERLASMTQIERAGYEGAYAANVLAAEVGDQVRQAREVAGLTQRELAARMRTSRATVVRLEGGGLGARLTTLQRAATALGLKVVVELRPSS